MKILWASPWNEHASNTWFGKDVVAQLMAMGHAVEIMRVEFGAELRHPPYPAPCPVHMPNSLSTTDITDRFDCVVVNLGNNFGCNGNTLQLLFETMPVVIMHDAWMSHFHQTRRCNDGPYYKQFDTILQALGVAEDDIGIGPFCSLASGAIVHGDHYLEDARKHCPGPVACFPLSYTVDPMPTPQPIGDRLTLATIGGINENKRAREVIKAMAASDRLKARCTYLLIGDVEDSERHALNALARELGAAQPVFTGRVPDHIMNTLIGTVDAICCLRHPIVEGASASVILAMGSGRPTLVSNQAVYAKIPDDLVMKCAPGAEAPDIVRHLEYILDHPEEAAAMGLRAQAYAARTYAPDAYADRLLDLLQRSIAARPAIEAARQIGRDLARIGCRPGDPAIARHGATLNMLLDSDNHFAEEGIHHG